MDIFEYGLIAFLGAIGILIFFVYDLLFVGPKPFNDDLKKQKKIEFENPWIYILIGVGLSSIFAFGGQFLYFWIITVIYLGVLYVRERYTPELECREVN